MMENGYRAVRRDCIDAFGRFFQDVNQNLDNVQVHIDGIFRPNTGKFHDNSKKEKRAENDSGTRACIMFGNEGRKVTTYAFHMPDLTQTKRAKARSMRFVPEDGNPPVMVVEAELGGDAHGVKPLADIADKVYASTSRAANSMSFGPMFNGWLSNGMLYEGSGEEAAVMELASLRASDGGIDWAAVKKEPADGDPLKAMAAWGMVADTLDGMANSKDSATSEAARKVLANTAYQSMGLSGLYKVLEKMDQKMAADPKYVPDLAAEADPDTPEGREALRGIMCLSAYKLIRDKGGRHAYDKNGVEIIGVMVGDGLRTDPVFERLNFARADAEHRQKTYAALDAKRDGIVPVHCTQKLFLGAENEALKPADKRVDSHMKYRFFRCAMLGEDPDRESGAPALVMYPREGADPAKLGAKDVMVSCDEFAAAGEDMDHVSMQDFLEKGRKNKNGVYGQVLSRMPAMYKACSGAGGIGTLAAAAADRLSGDPGIDKDNPYDAMCLEMDLFQKTLKNKGSASMFLAKGPKGQNASGYADAFVRNYQARMGESRRLKLSLNMAIGTPDFSKGYEYFGNQCLADIDERCYRSEAPGTRGEKNPLRKQDNAEKAAQSFRQMDCDRHDAFEVARSILGAEPADMRAVEAAFKQEGATGAYMQGLAKCRDAQAKDAVKGSMMLNDFVALSECYCIEGREDIRRLTADVETAYADGPLPDGYQGLYRPRDQMEDSLLRKAYENGKDCRLAVVPLMLQGSPEGFASAFNAAADGASREEAVKKLTEMARDNDTFFDTRYGDMADALSKSEDDAEEAAEKAAEKPTPTQKAMQMAADKMAARGHEEQDGRGIV